MKYNSDDPLTIFGFGEHRASTIAMEQFIGKDDVPYYVKRKMGDVLTTLRQPGKVDWTSPTVVDPSIAPYVTQALSDAAYSQNQVDDWDTGQAWVMIHDADHQLDPRIQTTMHGIGQSALRPPVL